MEQQQQQTTRQHIKERDIKDNGHLSFSVITKTTMHHIDVSGQVVSEGGHGDEVSDWTKTYWNLIAV